MCIVSTSADSNYVNFIRIHTVSYLDLSKIFSTEYVTMFRDRLCGLVVRVPGYRSRGPGLIPALPDFLRSSGSGTGSTQPCEYIEGAA
jgi:hypothetical protein